MDRALHDLAVDVDRRRHIEHPAQHHRGTEPRPAARPRARSGRMNFLLSEDQLAFLSAIEDLLRDRCDALRVHKIFDIEGDAQFDAELWAGLVEMGVPAIFVPEAHGGLGLAMVDLAIVSGLFGTYAPPVPWLGHALATVAIVLGGREAQKARWLPRLASGEVQSPVAFSEGKRVWFPGECHISGAAATLTAVKSGRQPGRKEGLQNVNT